MSWIFCEASPFAWDESHPGDTIRPFAYRWDRDMYFEPPYPLPIYPSGKVPTNENICEFCFHMTGLIPSLRHGVYPASYLLKRYTIWEPQSCHMCNFICESVMDVMGQSPLYPQEIVFLIYASEQQRIDEGVACFCELRLKQMDPRELSFSIWADEGSPASNRVTTQVPLTSWNYADIIQHTRGWLQECRLRHSVCRSKPEITCSKTTANIPSRILEISGDAFRPTIRLLDCRRRKLGNYCALSHCWGPPDKRPAITTTENLRNRLRNIDFEELPKTFQQAAVLTLGIGISYLWIDSLCIIQDCDEDWSHESKHMGSIYDGAALVIAAAGAKNSSEGLFPAERICYSPFPLPHITEKPQSGTIHAVRTETCNDSHRLSESPLRRRAWAFQEWYLSNRKVFFLPDRVLWACANGTCKENSTWVDLGLSENFSWISLLQQYSRRHLTFAKDRLIALQGIADYLQRGDRWIYGTWETEVTRHLLWIPLDSPNVTVDKPQSSSWCWAAAPGSVWFMKHRSEDCAQLPEVVRVNDLGLLQIRGSLLGNAVRTKESCEDCFRDCSKYIVRIHGYWSVDQEQNMIPAWSSSTRAAHHLVGIVKNETLGLALFDIGKSAHFSAVLPFARITKDESEVYTSASITTQDDEKMENLLEQVSVTHDGSTHGLQEFKEACESGGPVDRFSDHSGRSQLQSSKQSCHDDQISVPASPIVREMDKWDMKDESVATQDNEIGATPGKATLRQAEHGNDDVKDDEAHRTGEESSKKGPKRSRYWETVSPHRKIEHPYTENCMDSVEPAADAYVYWALMLDSVPGEDNTFKRVGLALLYPCAEYLFVDEPHTDIRIV